MIKKAIGFFFLAIGAITANSQNKYYQDPIFNEMATAFQKKEYKVLENLLLDDISGETPNAYTYYIAYLFTEDVNRDFIDKLGEKQKQILSFCMEVENLDREERYLEIYSAYKEFEYKEELPVSTYQKIMAASSKISFEESEEIFKTWIQTHGIQYRALWMVDYVFDYGQNYRFWEHISQDSFYKDYPDLQAYAQFNLKHLPELNLRNWKTIQTLQNINKYLQSNPDDPEAHRRKAILLEELNRKNAAILNYEKAYTLNPFYFGGFSRINALALSFLMVDEFPKEELAEYVERHYPNAKTKDDLKFWETKIFYEAGDKTKARSSLKSYLKTNPSSTEALFLAAEIEASDDRFVEAYKFLKQIPASKRRKNLNYHELWLECLKETEAVDEMLQNYSDISNSLEFHNQSTLYQIFDFFEKSNQYELAEKVQLLHESKFPNSNWTLDNLGYIHIKNSRFAEAEEVLLKSLHLNPVDSYTLSRYKEALEGNNKDVEKSVEKLAKQYPYSYLLKQEVLNSGDTKTNWEKFLNTSEEVRSPLDARLIDLKLDDNSGRGKTLINFHEDQLSKAQSQTDSLFFLDLLNWEYRSFVQKYKVEPKQLEKMLKLNKLYESLSGDLFEIFKTRAYLYRSNEQTELAQNAIQKAIQVNPTTANIEHGIINFQVPGGFKEYRKAVEKNLSNYEDLRYYILRNVTYGGSYINAIWAYEKCKSLYPGKDCQSTSYFMALKNFGNPLPRINSYRKSYNLGTTSRYIGWYDQTRQDVFKNLHSSFEYDENENLIKVFYENGEEFIQKDDPILAKPVLKQKGNIWIKYGYTENGKINFVETSAAETIKFLYNDKDQITGYDLKLGDVNRKYDISYNENDKMDKVILNQQDTLVITYFEDGEIDSTFLASSEKQNSMFLYQFSSDMNTSLSYLKTDKLENIHLDDEKYQTFKADYDHAYDKINGGTFVKGDISKIVNHLTYLKNDLHQDSDYADEVLRNIQDIFFDLQFNLTSLNMKQELLEVFEIYHEVLMKIRKRGVALLYWREWVEMRNFLEVEKNEQKTLNTYRKAIENLQKKFNKAPIKLLESAEWLPKSDLNLNAFWQTTALEKIDVIEGSEVNSLHKKTNGDLILSFDDRIVLKHKGYWKTLYYDALNSVLTNDLESIKMRSSTRFGRLTEVAGNIIVNTNKGTFNIDADYKQLSRIKTDSLGYIGEQYADLAGTDSTLYLHRGNTINILRKKPNDDFSFIKTLKLDDQIVKLLPISHEKPSESSFEYSDNSPVVDSVFNEKQKFSYADYILVQNTKGIDLLKLNSNGDIVASKTIFSRRKNIIDILVTPAYDLYILDGTNLFIKNLSLNFNSAAGLSQDLEVPAKKIFDPIVFNKEILGLMQLPVNHGEMVTAIITDKNLNIYKDDHFEVFEIDNISALEDLQHQWFAGASGFGLLTNTSLHEFSVENYNYSEAQPSKIERLDNYDITLSLGSDGLVFNRYDGMVAGKIETDGWGTSISDFYNLGNGTILVADYLSVFKASYDTITQDFESELLFEINPINDGSWITRDNNRIKTILQDKDGTIWMHTKVSVFRYNPQMTPALKEFSFLKNASEFPALSLNIFNLIQTYDGGIWVINDEEPWNDYNGRDLDGGLLIYNKSEDKFEFLDSQDPTPDYMPWFITSYTKINNSLAIAGTSAGFALHGPGGMKLISSTGSESYNAILKDHKNLFLGTEGVQFGDILLFGCPEGIIAYRDEQWFYPDRLNQLLPEFSEYGKYGGNKVNALEVDHLNRLQVATDLGSIIVDSNKMDPNDLLMMDYGTDKYLEYYNKKKLKGERELIVSTLTSENESKKIIKEADEIKEEIESLKSLKKTFDEDFPLETSRFRTVNIDSIDSEIKRMSDKHSRLLLTLKEKNPVIYQALKVPPLEIAGVRNKLGPKDCIVQYIPLENKLLIQLITSEKLVLKEIDISKQKLYDLALFTSDLLSNKDRIRGSKTQSLRKNNENEANANLDKSLIQLYSYLLEPIELELKPYRENTQIMAEGVLNYIPFEALLKSNKDGINQYALKDYNFTYLSSLYMYQLFDTFPESSKTDLLLVGDPDNTLPFARQEVESISTIYNGKSDLLIGGKARVGKFRKSSENKGILHLATHGYVDENTIKDSWLLFNDEKLSLSQIYEMNLDETNLVVLSACETGIGKEGIETTSLAQAFANAGVNYLIASLWEVNDESTKILMEKFYQDLNQGANYMDALHEAKKYLIAYENGKFSHPKYWSPFIIIGKS